MKHTRILHALGLVLVLASSGRGQVTQRVSVSTSGHYANSYSGIASISGDGFTVAFESNASNLAGSDSNGAFDVFTHRWLTGRTDIVSVDSSSTIGNLPSHAPSVSANGRFIAFDSSASNLVPGDTNGKSDIFLHDRVLGTTQRISVSSSGAQASDSSTGASISTDGRYVAFTSLATNLVAGDTNGVRDIFVRDRLSAVTERVSLSSTGVQGNLYSEDPSISGDGRYVAFESSATNLVSSDTNGVIDVFVRDRLSGATLRASVNNAGWQGDGNSRDPSISADGRFVTFSTVSTGMHGPFAFDWNDVEDVFCRDLVSNGIGLVSLSSTSVQGNGASYSPSISADGRFVAFTSGASNLVPGDTAGEGDVFVHDRSTRITERVSIASNGTEGNEDSMSPSISGDGRFVAFLSHADNLDPSDSNDESDIFLHDRNADGFTSVCHPGIDGVAACPCGNPPSATGRGCNNSSNTGGAFLTASGLAYLSADSLTFTTFSEKPTALSILLQGTSPVAAGAVYGQGLRCVGGTLKRLYTKTAVTGSITAPTGGDLSVSAQSAAKGDTILVGQSRWYLVYYRDGNVLGGCPAASTFNATQTGRVTWVQ